MIELHSPVSPAGRPTARELLAELAPDHALDTAIAYKLTGTTIALTCSCGSLFPLVATPYALAALRNVTILGN